MKDYVVIGEHNEYVIGQEVQFSDKDAKKLLDAHIIVLTGSVKASK